MAGAFRVASVIVAGTVEAAIALPSTKKLNSVAAEAAKQMFVGELPVAARSRKPHTKVVVEVEEEPRPHYAGEQAPDRDPFAATFSTVLNLFSHCHTSVRRAG